MSFKSSDVQAGPADGTLIHVCSGQNSAEASKQAVFSHRELCSIFESSF